MKKKKLVKYGKYGYFFSIPFIVAFLFFSLYPIIYTFMIAFTDLKGLGTELNFLDEPFGNFKAIFANKTFLRALGNTFVIWICNFIPQIGLALLLTAWFTDKRFKVKGAGLFKILFYMPNIITAATIAILFKALFDYPMSPVNDIMVSLGIFKKPVEMLQNKTVAKGLVSFIQFWMWYGYTMVILISGVLGIDPEIFEAAKVDGANGVQTFFKITIPNIRSILLFTLVTSLIGGLNMFDIPQLFLLGGPDNATLTTSVFIYQLAFQGSHLYARAAAASIIMFILIAILSAGMFYLMRDRDAEKIKKEIKEAERQKGEEA